MKNKRTYSLTAKERKQKRLAEQSKLNPIKTEEEPLTRLSEEQAMVLSQRRSKRTAFIIGAVVAIAIIMLIIALIVPVFMYIDNPYRNYKNVIARFELSNEMVLEYIIEENEYDIAASNFIFLAKNGYFNNTVLFDAGDADRDTDGWVRFGGYEKQPTVWEGGSSIYNNTQHHAQNKSYCEKFKAIPNKWFPDNVCNKFGYDLNADKNGINTTRLEDVGVLAYLYNDTSTEFQMSYKEQPSNYVSVVNNSADGMSYTIRELKPTMVGYALNNKTIENLKKIAATAQPTEKSSTTSGVIWCPPDPAIYIRSVKVYNLDEKKWENFNFIKYMTDPKKDGSTRYRGWTGKI
ncbi:MAG: hypothetical protein J1G38_05055 [Clostridiales bacterium]|nr:hypothetical protein [Clostridiales bacterium]